MTDERKRGERGPEGETETNILLYVCCNFDGVEESEIRSHLNVKHRMTAERSTRNPLKMLEEKGYLLKSKIGRDNIWRPNPDEFNDIAYMFLKDASRIEDFILSEYTQRTLKTLPGYKECLFHFPYLKSFFDRGILISPTFLLYLAAEAPEAHIAMMLLLPSSERKYSKYRRSYDSFCSIEQVKSPEEEVMSIMHYADTEPVALYVSLLIDYLKYRKLRDSIRLLLNDTCMESLYSNFDLPRPVFISKKEFGKVKTTFLLVQNEKE